MSYSVRYSTKAVAQIEKYKRSNVPAFKKLGRLLNELASHPRTGTGHPEPLKGGDDITWSRRITKSDRLVYEIHDDRVIVLVLSVEGHCSD